MNDLSPEKTLLACMMLDQGCIDAVAASVRADDFGDSKTSAAFAAIVALHGSGIRPDPASVRDEAKRHGVALDLVALAELSGQLVTAVSAEHYAAKVRAAALRRRLVGSAEALHALSADDTLTDAEVIQQAMRCVELASDSAPAQAVPREFWEIVGQDHPGRMQEREGGKRWYVTSGSPTIDHLTGGWQRGQLIVVAARMGVGKSAIACNFALNAARQPHAPRRVVIHSLEMPEAQVTDRLLAIDGHLNLLRLTKGQMGNQERERYAIALDRIWKHQPRIVVDDRLPATLSLIKARTRQHMKRGPVDLVIVDYLQRMTGQKGEKWERVGEDAVGLKTMARELDVPVIALAQLNREGGDEYEPTLRHLAGSDEIGREADVVILLHVPKEEAEKLKQPVPPMSVEVDCILAKVRQGQMGRVKLMNIPSSVTFAEPIREREEQAA